MEKEYQLIRLLERQNKQNKTYHLALVLYNRENDSDLLRILVKDDQVVKLQELIERGQDNVSKFVKIDYNSFSKQYVPVLVV